MVTTKIDLCKNWQLSVLPHNEHMNYTCKDELVADGVEVLAATVPGTVELDLKAALFCPTGDHAVKHLRPVLRLGSARAGVEGDDGVVLVIFAGEEHLNALLFNGRGDLVKLVLYLFYAILVIFFNGHFRQGNSIFKTRTQIVIALDGILGLLDGLKDL